ncbi:MAG TPA: efflux RND transporter periplasmic adaptor subunit [Candidatus Aminicenantes bacterium]|nr:efflux RND transporter periplasmic adaptor subunit [Candidatus Aminicenantes bacterium]
MKKRMIVVVAAALLAAACGPDKQEQTGPEKLAINVAVAPVQKGVFTRVLNYTGTVMPWKQAGIIPDVSGRVERILVKQGDTVRRGQLLAELDTTSLELQRKQAVAAAAIAGAALKDARVNAERMRKLHERNAVSSMQLEKAELALESALTQKQSAEANLNLVRHHLKSARMSAPFDGIITARHLDEGDMINPQMGGGFGVLTLMDLSRVKVKIDVVAEDIEKISVGMPCSVKVSTLADRMFTGTIYTKTLAADTASKTFQVEVRVENPDMAIKAGVFAAVAIEVEKIENVFMLPLSALIGEDRVVVYDNGFARLTRIQVGLRNETYFEVLGGLEPGAQVVVDGNYDLTDGAPIRISGEKP